MPAPKPSDCTIQDAEAVQYHAVEGKSLAETGKLMGVSRDTVKRIKKREAYHDLAVQALEKAGGDVKKTMEKLVAKTEAKYTIKTGTDKDGNNTYEEVDAHTPQLRAIERICDIYGVDAPKHLDVAGLIASASVEELLAEIAETKRRLGMDETGREPETAVDPSEKV
jgi:predicted DNA-binding protein (UPF0251 family)